MMELFFLLHFIIHSSKISVVTFFFCVVSAKKKNTQEMPFFRVPDVAENQFIYKTRNFLIPYVM